jgi:Flp pilus assembly protein TadG
MNRRSLRRRKGNIIVLTAVLLVACVALLAMSIDVGYLYSIRTELQRSADSAAIAAAWELIDQNGSAGDADGEDLSANAIAKATQFAALNAVGTTSPALGDSDVVVGYMANPSAPNSALVPTPLGILPNAVQARVQRTSAQNGQVSLFFGRVLGVNQAGLEAEATAVFVSSFIGFQAPSDGSNLGILPFALDEQTWLSLEVNGTDHWSYNPANKSVFVGTDGIKEVNLYPQGTGSPGNRGTVDIGAGNNSTSDLARQIEHGISADDFDAIGGSLEFGDDGVLHLNGDPGISAGVKDELASIIGKSRIIPLFRSVSGNGNNADYSIVKWVGIRVMRVDLSGGNKKVMVQPCNIVTKGGIYAPNATGTQYIYSPVWLIH